MRSGSACASSATTRSSPRSASASSAPSTPQTPEEVFAAADFLTLHLPLTDETRALRRRGGDRADARRRPDRQRRARRARRRERARAGGPRRARSPAPRSTSSRPSRTRASCSSSRTSSSRRISPPRPRRRRTAPALIVAEQVVAALEGGLVTNAVNIPVVGAEDLELLGPFIPLAAQARPAGGRARGRPPAPDRALVQRRDRRPRHPPAHRRGAERRLPGPGRAGRQLRQRAGDRGRARDRGDRGALRRSTRDYTNLVTVAVDDVEVSGTTIGPEHRHFLAGALGFAIDLQLSPRMVFFRYDDIPGVIGRVGTMFGEAASTSRTWPSRGRRRAARR